MACLFPPRAGWQKILTLTKKARFAFVLGGTVCIATAGESDKVEKEKRPEFT